MPNVVRPETVAPVSDAAGPAEECVPLPQRHDDLAQHVLKVLDPDGFADYAREAADLLARYSGRNILLDMKPAVLEGTRQPAALINPGVPGHRHGDPVVPLPRVQHLKEIRERDSELTLVVGETTPATMDR
jgi:hypothetical protein